MSTMFNRSWPIRVWFLLLTLSCLPMAALSAPAAQPHLEKVLLQLKWFHQFQFAGYYAAIEQGYFAEEGLEVEIIERDLEKSVVKQVVNGQADYGVGDSGLLAEYAGGEPIIALAAIFQHNPLVFISRQDSGIISPYEMVGKRIMLDTLSSNEAPLKALLADADISSADYTPVKQNVDYSLLSQGKVDVISGYITDQPYYFKQQGVKVNIINPQNYGIDFYGDILFTSHNELSRHPGRADRFLRAALKGWKYALDHPDRLIALIHSQYHGRLPLSHLQFEAQETQKLILPNRVPLGQIDPRRLKIVAEHYAKAGLKTKLSEAELAAFIYRQIPGDLELTEAEKAWLATHPVIRVGIDRDFPPYEWIDQNGNYVGMAADYIKLLETKLGIRFEIIGDRSWMEIMDMARRGQLDMLSAAVKTPERAQYLTFTQPFKAGPVVIIDNGQGGYIGSLDNLSGKRVAVEKGYFMQELLERHHPQIQLVLADTIKQALNLVIDGKADAYVGDAGSTNYAIKKEGLLSLRFSGQTEYRSQHSLAISKSQPELFSIINKAMLTIPAETSDAIFNRWLGLRIEQGIKLGTVLTYAAAVLGFFLIFAYWLIRLQREIGKRQALQEREQHRTRVMQLLTEQNPLPEVLDSIARDVENLNPGMLCSILLLDADGRHLRQGAAPSLPAFYNQGIDGIAIGPNAGSCGTAAFTGKRVIVSDIESHPYWAAYLGLAHRAKLGACWSQPILSTQGKVLGTFAIYHRQPHQPSADDLQLIEDEARLAAVAIEKTEAKSRLQLAASVFTHAREGIMITDHAGLMIDVNETFSQITGYPREEALGRNPHILQSGRHGAEFYQVMWRELLEFGYWSGEIWNRRKNGEIYAEMLTISAVRDDNGTTRNYVALFTDITDIKQHQQQLEHIAHYDALTGLPNRVLLADRLKQSMIQCQRHHCSCAVVYMDLDGFKAVNDSHGHDVGDELLVNIATQMKLALREGDTLARIGGDEFIAVLAGLEQPRDWRPVLARLLAASSNPVKVRGMLLNVSASIGVTLYPQDQADADLLLRHADQAMYTAKQAGKNRFHLFDVDHDTAVLAQRENLQYIQEALDRGEFVMHYQPKVNMKTGEVIGAEALIRWQHPQRGLLPPAEFLPIIETHPLSVELGEWVIETVLTQMSQWHAANLAIPVSINVSARQLQQENFIARLKELIAAHPEIPPSHIELEVLETSALEDIAQVSEVMHACQQMGVGFALDDFGTGYSSLTYLKRLPAGLLKIDRSFVRDMLDDHEDLAIVEGVIGLATAFRRRVIAEGVETVTHGELLLPLGCELAQGFGIARPMPAAELPAWIADWRPHRIWQSWRDRPTNRDDVVLVFTDVEHRHWLRSIENQLTDNMTMRMPLNAHDCHFGRWQQVEGLQRYKHHPEVQQVIRLHHQLHRSGQELIDAHGRGESIDFPARLEQLNLLQRELTLLLRKLINGEVHPANED
ncbi:EAL domain-containing protein [Methylomonas sp. LL1]|uniref:EAL domain-containing protein n=1 Tax=Methylomonas sp. LL1 TaxID=2785785 RepID=UPI0018C35DAD|nr:EAL domain-containing protein [Methylomonas sp. LL1]QPK61722.1 EAL domain-containing protein [Methylomonas sp. LL1]